jgi:N5-(cytidine 5'-diphosphoramidyl)-L-glutamine hydrolase
MNSKSRIIAVSQRVVEVSARGEVRDCLDQAWAVWLQSLGYSLAPVPNRLSSVDDFLKAVNPSGIILSGGNNLTLPVYEGAESTEPVEDAFENRDVTEGRLVEFAMCQSIPLLGCCRGMQYLQAFFGGRLSSLKGSPVTHVARDHAITFIDSRFEGILDPGVCTVNSFHNYGIRRDAVAPVFKPFAVTSDDSSVEGFWHRDAPIVGIMWHPERRNPAAAFDRKLFTQLFDAAGS